MFRKAKRLGEELASIALMAEINELEHEVREAHRSDKGRMTAVVSGHPIMQMKNVYVPIVAQWRMGDKEGKINVSQN